MCHINWCKLREIYRKKSITTKNNQSKRFVPESSKLAYGIKDRQEAGLKCIAEHGVLIYRTGGMSKDV
jgi:hypothetical protein